MSLNTTISAFCALGAWLVQQNAHSLDPLLQKTQNQNPWFTKEDVYFSLQCLAKHYLNAEKIKVWLQPYPLEEHQPKPKTIGLILAGNVPLVGWHDIQCCLIAGHKVQIKFSSKDSVLLPFLLQELFQFAPELESRVEIVERLRNFDAVIATGSNNSNRYFERYFGSYPNLLRGTKSGVAVLNGDESLEELTSLSNDIFRFYGLGCRSVSKIYVPENYVFKNFFEAMDSQKHRKEHSKFFHNYEYVLSLCLLNNTRHLANDFFLVMESQQLASPIASIHYQEYQNASHLVENLKRDQNQLQCLVARENHLPNLKSTAFGKGQEPQLWDYADGKDSLEFLLGL